MEEKNSDKTVILKAISQDTVTEEYSASYGTVDRKRTSSESLYHSVEKVQQSMIVSDPGINDEFASIFSEAVQAVDVGILPELSRVGTSGAYFIRSTSGEKKVGIFKPKDEEPYGILNPKWTKWMHKWCCPCCFGRSCLVPNQGYLSEAGASLVDERLGLGIVPKTRVVRLASETFNYNAVDRAKSRTKITMIKRYPSLAKRFHRLGLPPKVMRKDLKM